MVTEQPRGDPLNFSALTADAGLARLVAVKLVVREFARVRATPRLGGETVQPARPAAVGGFVAVGMQAGEQVGNRTPRANEGWFRKSFERISERDAQITADELFLPPRSRSYFKTMRMPGVPTCLTHLEL